MQYKLINPVDKEYSALEQVLVNRGIPYEEIDRFLNLDDSALHSLNKLEGLRDAAQVLARNLNVGQGKIYVQVDCDTDGFTASALLLNYLHRIVPSIVESRFYYGIHEDKTHGICEENILEDTCLVIVPDASSNEYDTHKRLREEGIDIIILDHHEADYTSPYAAVVNNQLCDYPNKNLSGVGVVYKFCQYLDNLFGVSYANEFLDLVAVGLVGDMMDQREPETARLIRKGLPALKNPFLVAMREKNSFSIGETLTPIGAAFYIVPFINAMTRSGTLEEQWLLFESMLDWKGYAEIPSQKRGCKGQMDLRVNEAVRVATNVKKRQTDVQDESLEYIKKLIAAQDLDQNKVMIIASEARPIEKNVAGLIANKLASEYQRPAMVLNKYKREDGEYWQGSARGYERFPIKDFKDFVANSNLSSLAQGHQGAFGIGFPADNLEKFIEYTNNYFSTIDCSPKYDVDFIYQANNFKSSSILQLGDAGHIWGQNLREPLIAIEQIKVTKDNMTLMSRDRNPTLKITLPNGVEIIKFKSSEEEFESLYSETGCVTINVVGTCAVNRYYYNVTPQIKVTEYEIIDKQDYYF